MGVVSTCDLWVRSLGFVGVVSICAWCTYVCVGMGVISGVWSRGVSGGFTCCMLYRSESEKTMGQILVSLSSWDTAT